VDIGEEQELCVRIFFGNARLKLLEYIQFREIGLGLVEVVEILPAQRKVLPFVLSIRGYRRHEPSRRLRVRA